MELRTDDGYRIERREGSKPVHLAEKRDGTGLQMLTGYASVFYDPRDPEGTQYELYPGCFERIAPGAFDRTLANRDDVLCLYNHSQEYLLGRTSSGTCRLSVDNVGLKYETDICDTTASQDVAILAGRMDIVSSSFAFAARDVSWHEEGGLMIRTILECRLYDVSPVITPAYAATTVSARDTIPAKPLTARQIQDAKAVEATLRRLDAEENTRRAQAASEVEAVMRRLAKFDAADVQRTLERLKTF